MENDLNGKIQSVSAEERQILSMKRKMKWWTAGLVMLTLVAAGLFSMVYFPGMIQKLSSIEISFGKTGSTDTGGTAYIGIEIRDLPKSSGTGGILVSRVAPGSPAAESGLKAGDIILRFNRTRVSDTLQFQDLVADSNPGDRIKLVIDRNDKTRNFYLILTERPAAPAQLTAGPPFSQDDTFLQWGCTLSPLTDSLKQKLSLPSDITGIAVVSVSSGGLARASGLEPGDVIVGVNQVEIENMADFYIAIKDQDVLTLKIFRDGSMFVLTIEQNSATPPLVTIAGSLPDTTPTAGTPTAGMPAAGTTTDGITGNLMPSRVAIASTGNNLNSQMALRFGTAPYFIVADIETGQYLVLQNTALADSRGYGILAAQLAASKDAGATIAGSYGFQAYNALLALNITPFTGNAGRVIDVFNQYRQASLAQAQPDDALSGFGYARNILPTGGAPFATDETDDEEEEQSGYKGMPYTIPPQGQYDPALDPANAQDSQTNGTAQQTAGLVPYSSAADSYLNLNQQSVTCICPVCNRTYEHPAGVPCSSLVCQADGSRLISMNPGSTANQQFTANQQSVLVSDSALPARVAIAADGNNLNSPVATRFGFANYFIIADTGTGKITVMPNTALSSTGGYGVTAARIVADQGAGATIAVSYGLPSYYALKTLGISVYTASPETVSTALNQYRTSSMTRMSTTLLPNSQNYLPTGGAPFATDETDDEEEEQSGYKGMPYTIPPQGQYDPELDPANQTTGSSSDSPVQPAAGTTQRAEYCLCPICQILVPHAPGIACSDMACPQCGNRLMNADPGTASAVTLPGQTTDTSQTPGTDQLPGQIRSGTSTPQNYITDQTQNQTRTGTGLVVAGMPTAGMPDTIPPDDMGQGTAGVTVAGTSTTSTGVLQGTIDGTCLCPRCGTTVPHVRGTSCATIACPSCGTPMIGENSSLQLTAGMPTAGMPTAGIPTAGMPTAGMPTAGMPTAGMPDTIPPDDMGQGTAGVTVAGTSSVSTGVLQGTVDGNCLCPSCGTTVPHVQGTSCATIACPSCGTPMIGENTSLNQSYTATAGTTTGGMPDTIPPDDMGQGTAGLSVAGIPNISAQTAAVTVSGMPDTIPPTDMGQGTAGLTVAGVPNISTQTTGVTVAGMPDTLPPTGMGTAGTIAAGMPETLPPTGTQIAGTQVAGSSSGKICVAATGTTINSQVADVFDKAPYFLLVGFGSMEVVTNPNVTDKTGSGVQSAQLVVSEGADVVITDDIGIKAIEELHRLQVKVYTGVTGTVKDALEWYQNNRLVPTNLNSSRDSASIEEDEEQRGPPSASKSKSKGESTTL